MPKCSSVCISTACSMACSTARSTARSSVCIPPGIGKLLNLVELPIFFVTSDSRSCRIGELNNLVNLESELQILGLQNICDKEEAEKAKLVNKKKLKGLTLQWSGSPCSSEMVPLKSSYMVLEGLQPNENLQNLTIRGFCGSKLSKWVGDRRFTKLVRITLEDCQNCDELPPLGQLQVLKHLLIQKLPKLKNVGPEFCGGTEQELGHTFPVLETLGFKMMVALEKWDGVKEDDLPRLHSLTIMHCNKLKTLPQLRSVRKVHVKQSPELHELPLLPSLQHMHICSGCPSLLQSCQLPPCFNKEKSCEKECLILVRRNQITFEPQCRILVSSDLNSTRREKGQLCELTNDRPSLLKTHSKKGGKMEMQHLNDIVLVEFNERINDRKILRESDPMCAREEEQDDHVRDCTGGRALDLPEEIGLASTTTSSSTLMAGYRDEMGIDDIGGDDDEEPNTHSKKGDKMVFVQFNAHINDQKILRESDPMCAREEEQDGHVRDWTGGRALDLPEEIGLASTSTSSSTLMAGYTDEMGI